MNDSKWTLPSRVEVSKRVGNVAGHSSHDGPFTAQVLDHDGGQEHGGDDDGGVDDAQRCYTHPLLCIQAALFSQIIIIINSVKSGAHK